MSFINGRKQRGGGSCKSVLLLNLADTIQYASLKLIL